MVGALVGALDNPLDLLLLLVLAVLIFGKQLPDVARSLGRGIRELRESVDLGEMGEALNSVNQVRSSVSPSAIARAAFPTSSEPWDSAPADGAGSVPDQFGPVPAQEAPEAPETPGATAPSGEPG